MLALALSTGDWSWSPDGDLNKECNTTQKVLKASSSLSFHSLSSIHSLTFFFFFFLLFFPGSLFSLKLTRSEKWDLILELSGGRLMSINLLNSTGVKGAAAAATLTGNRPWRSASRRHSNCVIYVCKDVWFKIEKLKKNKKQKTLEVKVRGLFRGDEGITHIKTHNINNTTGGRNNWRKWT